MARSREEITAEMEEVNAQVQEYAALEDISDDELEEMRDLARRVNELAEEIIELGEN